MYDCDKECRRRGPVGCGVCPCSEPRGNRQATNWLEKIDDSCPEVVEVLFKNTRNGFYSNPEHLPLKIGDIVAVEASPGHDIGKVTMIGPLTEMKMRRMPPRKDKDGELKKVFRLARQTDLEKFEEARAREHDTMIRSRKIAEELGLAMKIGDVEYQGDGGKAIFYYIADERVDFRKLIRILADTFKVRIEMKQIGARQEAGRIGGIGPCGRPLCCAVWMNRFVSVGTGAARIQDLSMNPQKLAGQCAKLKCCLNFEVDSYAESSKKLPPKDVTLETKDATYYYFKPDILSRQVTYSTDKNIPANLVTIDARRAFEVMSLNKQGIKVDSLSGDESDGSQKEYVDLVGQDSLTRFDKSKKKKKKPQGQQNPAAQKQGKAQPRQKQPRRQNPQQTQPKLQEARQPDGNGVKPLQQKRRPKPQKPQGQRQQNDEKLSAPKNPGGDEA